MCWSPSTLPSSFVRRQGYYNSSKLIVDHKQDFPQLLKPVEFGVIRSLMAFMQTQISAGTVDAPSWDTVRVSKLAARMYAPLGTQMALSDFVRVWRIFADAFSGNKGMRQWMESHEPVEWSVATQYDPGYSAEGADDEATDEEEFLRQHEQLAKDLSVRSFPQVVVAHPF